MDKAYSDINFARNHTLREYATYRNFQVTNIEDSILVKDNNAYGWTKEQAIQHLNERNDETIEKYKDSYENEKQGIVYTHCSGATLNKLESLGLIEIIKNSTNSKYYAFDVVKILNY